MSYCTPLVEGTVCRSSDLRVQAIYRLPSWSLFGEYNMSEPVHEKPQESLLSLRHKGWIQSEDEIERDCRLLVSPAWSITHKGTPDLDLPCLLSETSTSVLPMSSMRWLS